MHMHCERVQFLYFPMCVSGHSLRMREALLYEYTDEAEDLKDTVYAQAEKVYIVVTNERVDCTVTMHIAALGML